MSETAQAIADPDASPRLGALRRLALVPAYNEADSVASVVEEIRSFDPGMTILVVDDGSTDATAETASRAGATVVSLPFNLGIGGAVQTGFRYAYDLGYELVLRVDGDGQHDPAQAAALAEPVLSGLADFAVGSRFAGTPGYRSSVSRRLGIGLLARVVSLLVGERVTDPTSGFQVANRRAIALFAQDLPSDYPEVEATVLAAKHRLRRAEVPVAMRERAGGRSSIGALHAVYYMAKVLLALFVGMFRREVPR